MNTPQAQQESQLLPSSIFNSAGLTTHQRGPENTCTRLKGASDDSTPELTSGLFRSTNIETALILQHPLVKQARLAAHQEFQGHYRKSPSGCSFTPLPYVSHLEEVAQLLAEHGARPELVAAAYLHDHIEDLGAWTRARIHKEFNHEIAALVDWVTQQDKGDTWENRLKDYNLRLQLAPDEAKTLSAADKIANLRSYSNLMERGYPVESISKQGWQKNSIKFHELLAIFDGRVSPALLKIYRHELDRFDQLGKLMRPTP